MKIDPNAPAFPVFLHSGVPLPGLTIRAELAARFMAAHIAAPYGMYDREKIAQYATRDADALIAELNKP